MRRSFHYLHLLLELDTRKPEIRDSILVDPDPSKPLKTSQNPLQALKKLVIVSQVNSFEFSLTVENKYKSLVARLDE
jgi:hypothetical protein